MITCKVINGYIEKQNIFKNVIIFAMEEKGRLRDGENGGM
jgi:hypothetical protein